MGIAMTAAPEEQQPSQPHVAPDGRCRVEGLTDAERNFAIAMHLSPLAFFIIGPFAFSAPVVLWLIRKDNSAFNDDHGRETVNVMISGLIFFAAGFFTIGLAWLAFIVWCVFIGIGMIRGAVASSRGEFFRYPMTFRFIK